MGQASLSFLFFLGGFVTTFCGSGLTGFFFFVILVIVLLFLWLVLAPPLLSGDGSSERSGLVSLYVVANHGVPPELVDGKGPEDGDSVVHLVVVANPPAD